MREHPIPQDISGYKFHIVGNMTLKQFAEVAAGCGLALLIYITNLPAIIKWPLILTSLAGGALVAFVPFAERPLDHWLITFFKILYKPTKFFWRRKPKIPDPFTYQPKKTTTKTEEEIDLTPARKQRIQEYLTSVKKPSVDPWEVGQKQRVTEILQAFGSVQVSQVKVTPKKQKPQLSTRARNLKIATNAEAVVQQASLSQQAPINQSTKPPQPQSQLSPQQAAANVQIPKTKMVQVQEQPNQVDQGVQNQATTNTTQQAVYTNTRYQPQANNAAQNQAAASNPNLPFPNQPTEPNKIVGMALTPDDKLITNVVIEVADPNGQIVRAVKTNSLGQFFITTPLENGTYFIQAEKPGFRFVVQQLQLVGEAVPPLEIRSQ
ncbi:MAG: hypothetical protein GF390_01315 [Candidatus Pacebacteria bacterium]|nr:hypothetical protein [Candidatus Paceibacterota bacterium]